MAVYNFKAREEELFGALHDHINEQLDKVFKIALPEWDRIKTTVSTHRDDVSGRLAMRVDFLFDPNGLQ